MDLDVHDSPTDQQKLNKNGFAHKKFVKNLNILALRYIKGQSCLNFMLCLTMHLS